MFLSIDTFSFQKTLFIALIGALIGQLLAWVFSFFKRKINLNRKKKMILDDLKSQSIILDNVTKKHLELKGLLDKRETNLFTTSIFQTLQLDIYQSVSKNELHSIFKKNLFVLVDIYKSIEFIKLNGPYWIYKDYLEKSELHLEKKKNIDNHEFYCETHLGFIEIAIKNIDNNITTINEIISNIKKLTD